MTFSRRYSSNTTNDKHLVLLRLLIQDLHLNVLTVALLVVQLGGARCLHTHCILIACVKQARKTLTNTSSLVLRISGSYQGYRIIYFIEDCGGNSMQLQITGPSLPSYEAVQLIPCYFSNSDVLIECLIKHYHLHCSPIDHRSSSSNLELSECSLIHII